MDWTADIRQRLARHQAAPDEDVVLELAQHAAAAFEAARADGAGADEARDRVERLADTWCREAAGYRRRPRRGAAVEPPAPTSRGLTGVVQDARYGIRQLRRQPGFVSIALLVIALGIGATTTLFSVAYGVLRRPLPWPDADRIVRISEVREGGTRRIRLITTNATYLAWRDAPSTIDGIAAYSEDSATITGADDPERARVVRATASLFAVLRAQPLVGSVFLAADELPSDARAVVISFGLWQRRFGGRPDVVGQPLDIDGVRHEVRGVMPREFFFPTPESVAWVPFRVRPVLGAEPTTRSVSLFSAIARLRPGSTPEQAAAEGTARGGSAPDLGMAGIAIFGSQGKPTVSAVPYLDAVTADVKPALVVLLAAVILLLATAVANVAGMQLARSTSRRREIAIRAALGAGAGRLARQLLTENLLLGLAGGAAGLLLSYWIHSVLPSIVPADFPRLDDVALDWRVATFAFAASLLSTLAFGLFPALTTRRVNLVELLTEDSLAPVASGLRSRLGQTRALVMGSQVAVAAILLVGASLLTRSFIALMTVDRGYEPRHLLTAEIPLPSRFYTSQRRAAFLDALLERLGTTPGVTQAAAASVLPLMPLDMVMGFKMPVAPGQPDSTISVRASVRIVSPSFFDTMGLQILNGRAFTDADVQTSPPAALVNRTFARQYLSGQAIDAKLPITFDRGREDQQTVIGEVEDVQHGRATDTPQPQIYVSYRQLAVGMEVETPVVVMRTTVDPGALVSTLRHLVREQDRTIALQSVQTMEERLSSSLARPRLYATLLVSFAAFAVLVSGVGLFGVLSYNVTQRSREIGVRAALGARPIDIVLVVVRQSLAITIVGIAAGLAIALALVRHIGTLLYGVTTSDVVSFGIVPLAMVVVAIAACVAPARRAASVDPIKVLRS